MKSSKSIMYGCLTAATLMLAASCSNEDLMPSQNDGEVYGKGSNVVTFTITTDGTSARSRDGLKAETHLSDAGQVDALLFAVYEEKDGVYTIASEFGKSENVVGNVGGGTGQNAISVSKTDWPLKLKFAFDENKNYKIAFWAQNKSSNVFTTTDLTNVTVNYAAAVNNDEFRDAFCAVSDVITGDGKDHEVILHRPFAQVNLATSGADYNNILNGANIVPNKAIRYSSVSLKGAYNQIDVLNDNISRTDGFENQEVTFSMAKIPAFAYYNEFPANLVGTLEDGAYKENDDEEFLTVKLNPANVEMKGYRTTYPTISKDEETGTITYLTEKFKWLSMCYVLVPATKDASATDAYDKYTSSQLPELNFTLKFENKQTLNDETPESFTQTLNLANVPVHRNWRTNVICGLSTIDNPEDPKDPDDPTSVLKTTNVVVNLCPIFYNENNGLFDREQEGNATWLTVGGNFDQSDDSWHGQYGDHDGDDADETPETPAQPGAQE